MISAIADSTPHAEARGRGLRALVETDLPAVAALHRRVFGASPRLAEGERERRLHDVFWGHPWHDPRLPSLVYEEAGEIVGCLGVMPRPMLFDGKPIVAAVGHNFMVAPERRGTLAALEILRAFFAGPQDLSLADGNEASRRLWMAAGGAIAALASLRWTRALRPTSYAVSLLRKQGLTKLLAVLGSALSRVPDGVATRAGSSPWRLKPSGLEPTPLDAATLAECVERFSRRYPLRPHHTAPELDWLLGRLGESPDGSRLDAVALRKSGGQEIVGWYVVQSRVGAVAEVAQLVSTERAAEAVLEHLFRFAWQRGAIAVSGQLDAALLPAFSERLCFFHRARGGSWILLHSRDEKILLEAHRCNAFFTRLEGEWWIARHLGQ